VSTLEMVAVNELVHHPINDPVYQDRNDPEFVASIRENGVLTPLRVLRKGNLIISGHRRHRAAIEVGLQMVPVDYVSGLYEDEVLVMLVEMNQQRPRSQVQRAREANVLVDAENKRRRRLARAATTAETEAPKFDTSPRQVAAAKLGVSERTVASSITVDNALTHATAAGDTERAEAIRAGLQKSVAAGLRAATEDAEPAEKPRKPRSPSSIPDPFGVRRHSVLGVLQEISQLMSAVSKLEVTAAETQGGPCVYFTNMQKAHKVYMTRLQQWQDDMRK
jgi:ParB-like chromosome segregation protein Spo0J